MKTKLLYSLVLLAGSALLFNGCKKAANSTGNTTAATNKQNAAGQLAVNLYQSLTGQYGGINVYNGVNTPVIASAGGSTPKLNSDAFVCGFYVNTGINYSTNIGDTIKSVSHGSIAFYYVCNTTSAIGYNANDSLSTVGTAPGYSFTDGLSQKYIVTGLNSNNSLITVGGTIKSTIALDFTKGGKSVTYNVFTLNGLQVHNDTTPSDITSGTAVFTTVSVSATVTYALQGTLTFLGNHMAKIDYYDSIYYVNLLTGKVTTTI